MSNYPKWVIDKFGDNIPIWAEKKWGNSNELEGANKRFHVEKKSSLIKFSNQMKYILAKNSSWVCIEGLKLNDFFIDFILFIDNKIIVLNNKYYGLFSEENKEKLKIFINEKFSLNKDVYFFYLSDSKMWENIRSGENEDIFLDEYCLEEYLNSFI